jgi:GTP-binding protein HflX
MKGYSGLSLKPAVLISYKFPDSIEEAKGLCVAGGYQPVHVILMRQLRHGRFGVGEGKADEAKQAVADFHADQVIVDDKLTVQESYNLSKHCGCEVLDREKLVLEIFKARATTQEAVLQIKVAELTYELPRVRDYVRFVRMGEQPGMFGFGSYEVEKYYRNIKGRLDATRRKLAVLSKRREVFRSERARNHLSIASLSGYTSAGKTTLFNKLVVANQPVLGKMFSTLTTTTRRLEIGEVPVLLSDTVGFISRLPHYMIEAFKSTLEELTYADLVLLVVDVSDPEDRFRMKYQTCLDTLADLNVSPHKTVVVMNKVDLVGMEEGRKKAAALEPWAQAVVFVSAKTGEGLRELLSVIKKGIQEAAELDLILPPERASSISEKAKFFGNVVRVEKTSAEGGKVHLVILGPEWAIHELGPREFVKSDADE